MSLIELSVSQRPKIHIAAFVEEVLSLLFPGTVSSSTNSLKKNSSDLDEVLLPEQRVRHYFCTLKSFLYIRVYPTH
jgi:hypothetical protein